MESKKICGILIFIFAVLSFVFFQLYSTEYKKRTVIPEDLIVGVVDNLNALGVDISDDIIDRNMPESDIYFYETKGYVNYYKTVADTICDNVFGHSVVTSEFSTPNGRSFGIYDSVTNEKELGKIQFSESNYTFEFSKNGINISGSESPLYNGYTIIDSGFFTVISDIVSSMSQGSKLGFRVTGSTSNDEFVFITVIQTIDGGDINNAFMNFVFLNNELVHLQGNWIVESPKVKYHNSLIDGVNVLYKLDVENVKSIKSESVVYSLRFSENNKCFILPCWKIEYTDKSGNLVTEYFDAL